MNGTASAQLAVHQPAPGVRLIEIEGQVTRDLEALLQDAYDRAADGATTAIVLDFSGLEYMNSGGIGLLVTLLVRARRDHQRILACGLSEHYRQIFELTRLDEVISIYDTAAAAIEAAG
jgi:anti-sigma B factor antagonist